MSGEDSGYVPPDHKTTAEFGVSKKPAAPEVPGLPGTAAEPAAVDDLVDDLFDGDVTTHDVPQMDGVAFHDLPADDPEDDLETTYQDVPSEESEDDFDTTLRDGPVAGAFQKQPPADTVDELDMTVFQPPATLADVPLAEPARPAPAVPPQAQPAAFQQGANLAPPYAPSPAPHHERVPEPRPLPEQAPPSQQAPPSPQAPPAQQMPPAQAAAPMPAEAPWTEQFAAEEETANPAANGPAFAYGMPGAPPPAQHTMPPHHEAPVPPMPPPSRSRRPMILILLIVLVVVVVLIGVVALLLGRGSETGDKAAKQASPTASTPATGNGAGPASPGAPSPGGAPATPPQSGAPTNQPPGGQQPGGQQPGGQPAMPPPVTTAPVGPLVQGKGITYQLVQQDQGYFEGKLVITNRSQKPMKAWKLTFKAPGANVKNIWGARLVHGGSTVEIRNLDGAPAIPPGQTWDIQYGAAGTASTPKSCQLNGRACGF